VNTPAQHQPRRPHLVVQDLHFAHERQAQELVESRLGRQLPRAQAQHEGPPRRGARPGRGADEIQVGGIELDRDALVGHRLPGEPGPKRLRVRAGRRLDLHRSVLQGGCTWRRRP
jgi:hypothetical protein